MIIHGVADSIALINSSREKHGKPPLPHRSTASLMSSIAVQMITGIVIHTPSRST